MVGRKLLWPKLGCRDCEAHIILAGGFALARPACSNLDAQSHHARISYGVCNLVDIGQDADLSPEAGWANMAVVLSINMLFELPN